MTISQHIIQFNVSGSVFEVKAPKYNLCPKAARKFMSYTYGITYIGLDDVERFVLKFYPFMSETMQNEIAEAIVRTLFASHNVSPWA